MFSFAAGLRLGLDVVLLGSVLGVVRVVVVVRTCFLGETTEFGKLPEKDPLPEGDGVRSVGDLVGVARGEDLGLKRGEEGACCRGVCLGEERGFDLGEAGDVFGDALAVLTAVGRAFGLFCSSCFCRDAGELERAAEVVLGVDTTAAGVAAGGLLVPSINRSLICWRYQNRSDGNTTPLEIRFKSSISSKLLPIPKIVTGTTNFRSLRSMEKSSCPPTCALSIVDRKASRVGIGTSPMARMKSFSCNPASAAAIPGVTEVNRATPCFDHTNWHPSCAVREEMMSLARSMQSCFSLRSIMVFADNIWCSVEKPAARNP